VGGWVVGGGEGWVAVFVFDKRHFNAFNAHAN